MTANLALRSHLTESGLLDRFASRAIQFAEQAGIRWIELGGELWTLVSELERKKGVEPGDFAKNTALSEAHSVFQNEPSAALQHLLQTPGVKRASAPTAFEVQGGYALSCGGPGAKEGITALVRRQIPEWALAGYTLVNVPLALSYLMHGRSEVAKATRDLTISTTIDVGKAAAAQENAPIATMPFAGGISPAIAELLGQLMNQMALDQAATAQMASQAQAKAEDAKLTAVHANAKADKAISLAMNQATHRLISRCKPTQQTRETLLRTWDKHYQGICPCCHGGVDRKNLEVDHWTTKSKNELTDLWLVCRGCNTRLERPELDGGLKRTDLDRKRFTAFQQLMGMPSMVQGSLGLTA